MSSTLLRLTESATTDGEALRLTPAVPHIVAVVVKRNS